MTQSLVLVGLFLVLLACLPLAIARLKKHYGVAPPGPSAQGRLVSALAVGPHQKVLTVEVGPESARTWLVLGVTAQSITCLHTLPAPAATAAPQAGAIQP
jgi:flagellar protein FliO/FliZ